MFWRSAIQVASTACVQRVVATVDVVTRYALISGWRRVSTAPVMPATSISSRWPAAAVSR